MPLHLLLALQAASAQDLVLPPALVESPAPPDWATLSRSSAFPEPFGAEDVRSHEIHPLIPEPLVFDLVRPLGEKKGAAEVNVLTFIPLSKRSTSLVEGSDPLGIVQVSRDPNNIEWAPEYEVAIADGFAIEFEFPFEGGTLEAYKFAAQWTFGTAFDDQYIHGTQAIVEPTTDFSNWNLVLLYIGGIQFDETWSALGMIGARTATGPGIDERRTETLLNFTLFAHTSPWTTLGVEANYARAMDGLGTLLLTPQAHLEITDNIMLQLGIGIGFERDDTIPLGIFRAIYSY